MNDDEVTSNLAYLVDDDFRLDVDVDQVIQTGIRRRRRGRTVIGAALGTVGLVAGLLAVTSQVGGGVDAAAPAGWTTVDTSALGRTRPDSGGEMSGTSPSDIWMIGRNDSNSVALHWDGTSVTGFDLPMKGELRGIAAVAPDDVWAVGDTGATVPSGEDRNAQIVHWNGTNWQDVPIPGKPAGSGEVFLNGVSAVSADDVWAVGEVRGPLSPPVWSRPLVMHWDGRTWQTVNVPTEHDTGFQSVVARAADDVWISAIEVSDGGHMVHQAMHWDGTTWTVTPSRWDTGGKISNIVKGPDATWLYGELPNGEVALQRWDGSRWADVPLPPSAKVWGTLTAAADGRSGFVMVGTPRPTPTVPVGKPVVWHWDGARWSEFPTPASTRHVAAVGVLAGTDTMWVLALPVDPPSPLAAFRQIG